jgi:hypothetical protein
MPISLIWLKCRVPEGSADELHWRFMLEDCWIIWDSVLHTIFYLTVWFQRERFEALLVVSIIWYNFSFHAEVS